MPDSTFLRAAVTAAFAYAVVALAAMAVKTYAQGHRPDHAPPAGSARAGVLYAFFRGMLPWEKESVSGHIPTFVAGMIYHAGVFLSLFYLFFLVGGLKPPIALEWILRVGLPIGLAAGVGLLIKRAALPKMRAISVADDFVANLFVNLFLVAAWVAATTDGWEGFFLAAAAVLFVYMPLGKIRHCVFFFYTRAVFGVFFGRRGVLPHPRHEA
jgi:hypothetical protein